MKKFMLLLPVLGLAACGTAKIPGYEGPKAMQQHEVISASRSCTNTRMKPSVVYLAQKTEFGSVLVPVGVNCDPYKF